MFFSFRKERQGVDSGIQFFAGVNINSDCKRIETALIGLQGSGSGAAVLLQKNAVFDLPIEIANAFDSMKVQVKDDAERSTQGSVFDSDSGPDQSLSDSENADQKFISEQKKEYSFIADDMFSRIFAFREMILPFLGDAVDSLFDGIGPARKNVMLASFLGPDFRYRTARGIRSIDLFDPLILAERSGLNILSSFSDKDLVCGGSGKNLPAFCYWIYLNHPEEDQILLDLGQIARWTLIPADRKDWERGSASRMLVPCGALLDPLALQASGGKFSRDHGGRLSVMGRKIPDLIRSWHEIADSSSADPSCSPLPYLVSLFASEIVRTKNPEDILCSAVHWIAERIALYVDRSFSRKGKILLTGGGKCNGLLYTTLMKELLPREIVPIDDLGFPSESFDAMAVAMLGVLFFHRISLSSSGSLAGSLEWGANDHRDLLIRGMN